MGDVLKNFAAHFQRSEEPHPFVEPLHISPAEIAIHALSQQDARAYWENLATQGMPFVHEDVAMQYGHPIEISQELSQQLLDGATIAEAFLREQIARVGLTRHLEDHPMMFAGEPLNFSAVNAILEERLRQDYRLPMAYDCVIAQDSDGSLHARLFELQAVMNYESMIAGPLSAIGKDPQNNPATWQGPVNPEQVFKHMQRELAGSRHITIIHTNLHDVPPETNGMAKILGDAESTVVQLQDIRWDTKTQQYYYNKYQLDPKTKHPLFDATGNTIALDPPQREYITDYISYILQPDFTKLTEELTQDPHAPEKIGLMRQFLGDGAHVNPLWHPAWSLIADKSTLADIRQALLLNADPNIRRFANHYVPVYRAGEKVPPGTYIVKPTDAFGGHGQHKKTVHWWKKQKVPQGYVYQERITPYAFPITDLDETMTHRLQQRRARRRSLNPVRGIIEFRACVPPMCETSLSCRLVARFAPEYASPTSKLAPQTNMGGIIHAVDAFLPDDADRLLHERTPFGWAPVYKIAA